MRARAGRKASRILRRPGCSYFLVLARHRRVRRAGPTRLTDYRPLLLPCSNPPSNRATLTNLPWRPPPLSAVAPSRWPAHRLPASLLNPRFGSGVHFVVVVGFIRAFCLLLDSDCLSASLCLSVLSHLPFLCEHRSGYLRSRAVYTISFRGIRPSSIHSPRCEYRV